MPLQTEVAAPCGMVFQLKAGAPEAELAALIPSMSCFDGLWAQVTAKLGLDATGMHGRGPHAVRLVPSVELDGEQDVGGLRAAIGPELGIGRVLEVRIVEVNVGEPMTRRGQVDQARAGLQQRDDAVD